MIPLSHMYGQIVHLFLSLICGSTLVFQHALSPSAHADRRCDPRRQRCNQSVGMDPGRTLVVSIVGVDGCGKSSAFRGALSVLAQQVDVVGIGDVVLAGAPGLPLHRRDDLRLARATALVTRSAKRSRRAWLYRQLKSIDLIGRSRMRDHLVAREAPTVLLTDGDPLVNTISWSVASLYRQDLMGQDERVLDALRYLAGERRIPLRELPYYLRTAWQLVALNRLHLARFRSPDVVIQLQIDGATAMRRIGQRGRPLQPHETEAFLSELADGYDRVCGLIATRCGVPVIQVSAERHSRDEIVRVVSETVLRRVVRPSVPGEDLSWQPSRSSPPPCPGPSAISARSVTSGRDCAP